MKIEAWVNVYKKLDEKTGKYTNQLDIANIYSTKEEADRYSVPGRVQCVRMEAELDLKGQEANL